MDPHEQPGPASPLHWNPDAHDDAAWDAYLAHVVASPVSAAEQGHLHAPAVPCGLLPGSPSSSVSLVGPGTPQSDEDDYGTFFASLLVLR
jgi:hypothetical protein